MWIKSQDRETLGNYYEIQIVDSNKIAGCVGASASIIGSYESKGRAKEVLNQIQGFLLRGTKEDTIVNGVRTMQDKVFYMPIK